MDYSYNLYPKLSILGFTLGAIFNFHLSSIFVHQIGFVIKPQTPDVRGMLAC